MSIQIESRFRILLLAKFLFQNRLKPLNTLHICNINYSLRLFSVFLFIFFIFSMKLLKQFSVILACSTMIFVQTSAINTVSAATPASIQIVGIPAPTAGQYQGIITQV